MNKISNTHIAKNKHLLLLLICWLLIGQQSVVWGQDVPPGGNKEIDQETIDIVKPYEPVLADAVKIDFAPALPSYDDLQKQKLRVSDYIVPNRLLTLSYQPPKLKPLAYRGQSRNQQEKLQHFWLRAGFGNLTTPLVDLSASTGKSNKYVLGANASFIASKGNQIDFQEYNKIRGEVYGKLFLNEVTALDLDAGYQRNTFHYYGYNQSDETLPMPIQDSIQQIYNQISVNATLSNTTENELGLDYNLSVGYINFFTERDAIENVIFSKLSATKYMSDNFSFGGFAHILFSNTQLVDGGDKESNFLVNATPTISATPYFGKFTAGASLLLDNKAFRPFPYIQLDFFVLEDRLTVFANWKKDLVANNYQALSTRNPFMGQDFVIHATHLEERSGGLKGTIGKLAYLLKGYQKIGRDQPLFVNEAVDTSKFTVVYDTLTTVGGMAEVSYQFNQKGSASLAVNFNSYKTRVETEAWHLPTLGLSLRGEYELIPKLTLGGDIFMQLGMKGRLPDGTAKKLKNIIDLNVAARYDVLRNLSFFVNLNNLAFVRGESFLNYPTYRFNALGGAILKF